MDFDSVLDSLVPEMTPEQIDEGKKLVADWRPVQSTSDAVAEHPLASPKSTPSVSTSTAPPPEAATGSTSSTDFGGVLKFVFWGAIVLMIAIVWARRKRKPLSPDGYAEVPINIQVPYARSFRWKRDGYPQEGFEVTFVLKKKRGPHFTEQTTFWYKKGSINIDVTPDAVTIDDQRYRRTEFKGFLLTQSRSVNGSRVFLHLSFKYGAATAQLGSLEDYNEHQTHDLVAALNDRLQEVRSAAGDRADSEQLRNSRPSDF